MILTTAQRTAAIAQVKAASRITLSTVAAGRIVDAMVNTQTGLGQLIWQNGFNAGVPSYSGYAKGYRS